MSGCEGDGVTCGSTTRDGPFADATTIRFTEGLGADTAAFGANAGCEAAKGRSRAI